jgi:hypothetical protein
MKNKPSIQSSVHAKKNTKKLNKQSDSKADRPQPVELGGPKGPEPTRYGDWEQAGRCTDF